ncbi:MAG: SET domain-containing protein [Ferruginibacter sp.]
MALLEKQLEVKHSTLPASGKGLFTTKPIVKGTRIVEYKGKITTWAAADHDDGNNAYIYYISRNHVIDASGYKNSVARYANDAAGLTRIKGVSNNAHYVMEGKRIFIESTKVIPAGAEIFVAYGKDYWDVIRKNKVLG